MESCIQRQGNDHLEKQYENLSLLFALSLQLHYTS